MRSKTKTDVCLVLIKGQYWQTDSLSPIQKAFKGIVHFEINFWYVLAYLKRIQDVGVYVSTEFSILIFLGQTVVVCQSYNESQWGFSKRACTEKSKLNMI